MRQQILVWLFFEIALTLAYLEIELRDFEQSTVDKSILDFLIKVRKGVASGPVNLYTPVDETFEYEAKMLKKEGGEYRLTAFRIARQNFCEYFSNEPSAYEDVAKNSDLPDKFSCPIPAGNYTINKFAPSMKNFPVHLLASGDYAADVFLYKSDKLILSTRGFFSLINI